MIITFTIFNDPSQLGKAPKRRNIKTNYAFHIHGGVPAHSKVSFHSWAKATKGQVKLYKKPITVEARKPIEYFTRAIEKYQPAIRELIKKHIKIIYEKDEKKFKVIYPGLIEGYTDIANRIKNEAEEIIRAEAFDTGDLMSSVSITAVKIEGRYDE
jgi:hypothetical protein